MKMEYLKRELNLYRLTGSSSDDTLNKLVKNIIEGKEGDYIYVKSRKIASIRGGVGTFEVDFLNHIMLEYTLSTIREVHDFVEHIILTSFNIELYHIKFKRVIR